MNIARHVQRGRAVRSHRRQTRGAAGHGRQWDVKELERRVLLSGLTFAAPAYYSVGTGAQQVALGDFNGDQVTDMAVANYGTKSVSILLGTGSGTFGSATTYLMGSQVGSVVVGDFNGDQHDDFATANPVAGTVSVRLANADGTFGPKTDLAAFDTPQQVAVGDFNGDQKLDLAVSNKGSSIVSVYPGNGDGTFGSSINWPTASSPYALAAGHFTSLNQDDLALTNSTSGTVQVVWSDQYGTVKYGPDSYTVGSSPYAATTGDFNNDGRSDLAVANYGDGTVSVLLGAGDGTFGSATTFGAGANPLSVASGDINGDGAVDLVVANATWGSASVLLGDGTGTFAAPVSFNTGSGASSVAVGDFNGDGKPDLAVSRYSDVAVLLNTTVFPPVVALSASAYVDTRAPFAATATLSRLAAGHTPTGTVSFYEGTTLLKTVPLSGLTAQAYLTLTRAGDYTLRAIYSGDGYYPASGAGQAMVTVTDVTLASGVTYRAGDHPRGIAAGDFNEDGHVDLAVASDGSHDVNVLLNDGQGGFGAATSYSVAGTGYGVVTADLNHDGHLDLAVPNNNGARVIVLLGDGAGNFTFSSNPLAHVLTQAVAAADFNGDGKMDLAAANAQSDDVSIMLGNGDGTFPDGTNVAAGSTPTSIATADFNGDHKPDLVLGNSTASTVSVLLGNGNGTFAAAMGFAVAGNTLAVAVGDFNGDGKPDLAVGDSGMDILLGKGDGTFGAATHYSAGVGPRSVAVGDLNGDRRDDVVVASNDGNVYVLVGHGDGTFEDAVTFAATNEGQAVALADVNGDGQPDVITGSYLTAQDNVTVLRNTTAEPIPALELPAQLVRGEAATVAAHLDGLDANQTGVMPTGSVTFYSGSLALATVPVVNGMASATLTLSQAGPTGLLARYLGDSVYPASFSHLVTRQVTAHPEGHVDQLDAQTLAGWAADRDNLAQATQVRVVIDGNSTLYTADKTRNDLVGYLGSANHGFQITMPTLANGLHTVAVYAEDLTPGQPETLLVEQHLRVGPVPQVVYGTDRGGAPLVRVFDAVTNTQKFNFYAYSASYLGGVRVAQGDVNGDGVNDIITSTNSSGAPLVKVFSGTDGHLLSSFFAYDAAYWGGVVVAAGDVNGDGRADIIVGTKPGGVPLVRVFDGLTHNQLRNFFAFNSAYRGGVNISAGDVDGDGYAEIVTSTFSAGVPLVRVYSGRSGQEIQNFYAYDPSYTGGVVTAVGDVNGDGKADVAVGQMPGGNAQVRVLAGVTSAVLADFAAYSGTVTTGVRLTVLDINDDGKADVTVVPGPGRGPLSRTFSGADGTQLREFYPFAQGYWGGVFVA